MKVHSTLKVFLGGLVFLSFFANYVYSQEHTTMRLFDEVVFYDGYRVKDNPDKDKFKEDGILRNYTYLYAVKMTPEQLDQFGDSIVMNVWVKACCDNYDRIGNINLAFVYKNGYDPYNNITRIELGRFITPFMDKNKQPDTVPYSYRVDYLSSIFRDKDLRDSYDFWLEFELFGVPYAANEQIKGCAGRSDVFFGTLEFSTNTPAKGLTDKNVLVPIVIKKPEYMANNLNNYNSIATDTLGKTVKTYSFYVPKDVTDGQIVLITSNHGANAGGEEYNRRWHYVYITGKDEAGKFKDRDLVLTYKPGRTSCEPFRKYNTQGNGIYGWTKQSDEAWQSFSNWCPGDVIDNRIINLGAMKAGDYKLTISVPDAVFADKQGDIPVSAFFQGLTEGQLPTDVEEELAPKQDVTLFFDGEQITLESNETILDVEICDVQGKLLYHTSEYRPINISSYPGGMYLVNVELSNGMIETHKLIKK